VVNTILLIIIALNSFLGLIMLLAMYSKSEDLIEYKERQSQAIINLAEGMIDCFKSYVASKSK